MGSPRPELFTFAFCVRSIVQAQRTGVRSFSVHGFARRSLLGTVITLGAEESKDLNIATRIR